MIVVFAAFGDGRRTGSSEAASRTVSKLRTRPALHRRSSMPAKQNSSGGKDKLGSISKQGDRYLQRDLGRPSE